MVIFCAYVHPNGFFISTNQQDEFWILLSKQVGWGRFCLIRPESDLQRMEGFLNYVKYVRQMVKP